jgi:hypothetical protein
VASLVLEHIKSHSLVRFRMIDCLNMNRVWCIVNFAMGKLRAVSLRSGESVGVSVHTLSESKGNHPYESEVVSSTKRCIVDLVNTSAEDVNDL